MWFMPWIERCKTCNRPFSISKATAAEQEAAEEAEIDCPHCNDVWETRKAGSFTTSALSPEEEHAFEKGAVQSEGELPQR
jgi:DNA-directed RNA polymerase subunit RPC12/RpoP